MIYDGEKQFYILNENEYNEMYDDICHFVLQMIKRDKEIKKLKKQIKKIKKYICHKSNEIEKVTNKDIGKLCYFYNFNDVEGTVGILRKIGPHPADVNSIYYYTDMNSPRIDNKEEFEVWGRCRRLTKAEVEELTGYKVLEG